MTNDLEARLSDHYADVAAQLELPEMTFEELLAGTNDATVSGRPPAGGRPTTRWLAIAAAVLLFVVGLAAIARPGDDQESVGIDRPSTLLSTVAEIGDDEWVIAGPLPAGVVWMYALDTDSSGSNAARSVIYGNERESGTFERLRVRIGVPSAPEGDEIVDIAGAAWALDTPTSGMWTASRQLGATTVSVSDSGPFGQEDRDLIAGLVVVPVEQLPFPPLGDRAGGIEVASFDLDGVVQSFLVQESNGFGCTWVVSSEGESSGCGHAIDRSAAVTIDGGFTTVADGATTAEVVMAGTVSVDSARVEVEFSDGIVVEVTPTDLSGQFDRKFWIAGSVVPAERRSLVEVRSYDDGGRLLGAETDR